MIKHISLDHSGGWYHFRLHSKKINELCKDFPTLKGYLNDVFKRCPNDYFRDGPRSSSLRFKMKGDIHMVTGHEISYLTRLGLDINEARYNTDHSKVQVFLLENDDKSIAVEIPLWLEPSELKGFKKYFNSDSPLTGHIDLLRVEDSKIWIWDYKPGAYNEKYASTQVYFYALMLSKRTGISLDKFRCGYFDNFYSFIFNPAECALEEGLLNFFS